MVEKRPRGSPTGITPRQRDKRAASRLHGQGEISGRRKLAFSSVQPDLNVWTNEEELALVDYLLSKGFHESWPQTKKLDFWESAALLFISVALLKAYEQVRKFNITF